MPLFCFSGAVVVSTRIPMAASARAIRRAAIAFFVDVKPVEPRREPVNLRGHFNAAVHSRERHGSGHA